MTLGIRLDNNFYNTLGKTPEWYAYLRQLDIENMQRTVRCIDEGFLPTGAYAYFLEFAQFQRELHYKLLENINKKHRV